MRSDKFFLIGILILVFFSINFISASEFGVEIGNIEGDESIGVVMGIERITTVGNADGNASSICSGSDEVLLGNGSCRTSSDFAGSTPITNIFDQDLNTTNNVTFNNITVTTDIVATTGFFNLAWSFITNIPNILFGIDEDNNIDSLLVVNSSSTGIGYDQGVLNSSITNIISDQGISGTNISIEHGNNGTDIIPILLTAEGKQRIVMSVDLITSQNETCTFVPSPDESTVLEVCDA